MTQIMGVGLLLAAAMAVVIRLRKDENIYVRALQCALAIVKHTERKIRLYDSPTEDILRDFDNSSTHKSFRISGDMGFEEAVKPILNILHGQEQTVFAQFVEKLGRGYKDDALKLCEFTLVCLEERTARAEAEHPSRLKLYTALPIMFAVSVLVLIL